MQQSAQAHVLEALRTSETCWSQVLGHIDLARNPYYEEIINGVKGIREKLQLAAQFTATLYESNVHCLAKIAVMQQEQNQMQLQYEERIKV